MVDRILEVVDNLLDAHSGVSAASVQGITNSQVEQRIRLSLLWKVDVLSDLFECRH